MNRPNIPPNGNQSQLLERLREELLRLIIANEAKRAAARRTAAWRQRPAAS